MNSQFRQIGIIALLLVVGVARGQEKKEDPKPEPKMGVNEYFPLGFGMSWTYNSPDGKYTMKVVGKEKENIGDYSDCVRIETVKNNKVIVYEHFKVEADGAVNRCAFQGEALDKKLMLLPPNPEKPEKDSWTVDLKMGGIPVKATLKISTEPEWEYQGKKYPAVKVVTEPVEVELVKDEAKIKATVTWYYAKGIGMYKQTVELEGNPPITSTLEKFEKP